MATESHEPLNANGAASDFRGWRRAHDALRAIRALGEDWDGDGARAPRHGVVDAAIQIGSTLARGGCPEPTSTGASPSGTIVMSWQDNGEYLELEIVSAVDVEWMAVSQTGAATHGTFALD